MRFLVLTAAGGVTDAVSGRARALVDGDVPNRLSDNAVEIAFSGDLPAGVLTGEPIDVNVVSAQNRRKKLLIADMDSTMIPVECIDELADFAGVKSHVEEITERSMRGELNFEASIIERVALLKGLPESALEQCYAERISLNPGAKTLVQTMNKLGAMTALVSGGFRFFTGRVAVEAGFQMNQANELLFDGGKLSGKVGMPILGQQAKQVTLNALCEAGGYTPADVLAVGDGANDRSMVQAAGLGVAYRAKQALADVADVCLNHSDITALLALQGIGEDEYA
ncbi:MAG: phosphoserine phosphatase SerB [Paracoccaceae bacterium]|jgi:phosphoserine phosphatase